MTQTILITGSSAGIGKATAKYFHDKGWNVIATMRTPANETELNQLDNVLVTRLDVTDSDSIRAAVEEGVGRFGKIDVLLNNAGYGAYGPLETFPMENIRRQFDTNVIGLLETTKAVLPHMRKQRSGTVINVSSVGGKMCFPLGTLYHGTKFAVEGMSESLRWELEPLGIDVKIVEPGAIATDFGGRSFDFVHDESVEEYRETVTKTMNLFEPLLENAAPAKIVAEVIWEAATDGTSTLRYLAGEDAKAWVAARTSQDDEAFTAGLREQIGW